jgi:hypothetical protein
MKWLFKAKAMKYFDGSKVSSSILPDVEKTHGCEFHFHQD